MARRPDDFERWRGSIETKLDGLIETAREDQKDAKQHRSDLRTVIAALSSSVQGLTQEMREVRPHVDVLRNERQQAIGAAKQRRTLFAALAALCGMLGAGAIDLIKRLFQ